MAVASAYLPGVCRQAALLRIQHNMLLHKTHINARHSHVAQGTGHFPCAARHQAFPCRQVVQTSPPALPHQIRILLSGNTALSACSRASLHRPLLSFSSDCRCITSCGSGSTKRASS